MQATETISGTAFSSTFTYDSKGRLNTTTHPSGIVETNTYNDYGYLSSVAAGGATRWTTLAMNSRGQVTSGRYGAGLSTTLSYNSYGFPTSVVTGSLRSYQYEFNSVTGNLNWRKNAFQSDIQENFEYDNLDRLDRVYRGGTTLLDMAYDAAKGGITTKSDVGTLVYNTSSKPYALKKVSPSTGLIPTSLDSITYTSFESVNTILEGVYYATFTYNSDNERIKMVLQKNGSDTLTRWYPSGNYIKETANGVTRFYTFIGGDAYSAPCVAIKQQGGTTKFYYILRDYLGSITHVIDTTGTKVAEYSYDPWGRMRNVSTWVNYSPGSEPALMIAGRGFTGHEHLPWFNLINMNGRVYDPLTGQFLSVDNFVQSPDLTQGFNRYAYALNNPLAYTDQNGEFIFTILAAIFCEPLIPLAINLDYSWMSAGIASWSETGNFWQGAGQGLVTGVINGALNYLTGNIAGMLPNGILGATTSIVANGISNMIYKQPLYENWGYAAAFGFASGAFSGYGLAKLDPYYTRNIFTGEITGLKYHYAASIQLSTPEPSSLLSYRSEMLDMSELNSSRLQYPVDNPYISSDYGMRNGEMHYGVDFVNHQKGAVNGKPVYSVTDGKIVRLVTTPDGNRAGTRVRIQAPDGYQYNYFHLQNGSNAHLQYYLQNNMTIHKGDFIGNVGNTGVSRGAHLHFEIWNPNGFKVNPYNVYPTLFNIPHL